MPKPFLKAALGVALALCSAPALAAEDHPGTFGFISGGGQGGDLLRDKSNYFYAYLGSYYESPKISGPLSWRFSALGLSYSGIWFQPFRPGEAELLHLVEGCLMTGPSFNVDLPGEWWLWDGFQAGLGVGSAGSLLTLQNELMVGRGLFFSTYWKLDLRMNFSGELEMRYLAGQTFFRLLQWLAIGPELRFQTATPSVGLLAQVGEDRLRPHWNVTAGFTFDDKVGGQWHLDLWYAF